MTNLRTPLEEQLTALANDLVKRGTPADIRDNHSFLRPLKLEAPVDGYADLLEYHYSQTVGGRNKAAAETRLIGTIPGVDVDPDNPDPMRHPQLVTPAVLLMCAEDAPTGKTIHAGNGRFSTSATFVNEALEFGADVSYEDLLAQKDKLLDLSEAGEMSGLIRLQQQRKQ